MKKIDENAQPEEKSDIYLDKLFDFLVEEIRERDAPPTYDDIGKTLGYTKGLGHDDLYGMPCLTTVRKKIIEYVAKYMRRNSNGPSVYAIACALSFSNNKTRRHVDYLDSFELVSYSPKLMR
ncbi:hypothetical protein [Photorhabdus luminescens]|uniref:LexA repressor DNA-binding domain-containing protein n=1 Tax=Photorhabdus luminescens subsp. mexicana TaxID=2100167 RepID=A0A4R4J429_PHOLU|nr:hypothetical protein [Photorhabdus luminescens]TDB47922.1 hypothetical protein C5468_17770 [Photorhabdus luminescens subsp. mexicana]